LFNVCSSIKNHPSAKRTSGANGDCRDDDVFGTKRTSLNDFILSFSYLLKSDWTNWIFISVQMREVSLFTLVFLFVCFCFSHAYPIIGFGLFSKDANK
jgi:hypothetical protein